ncbi:olfactomedin-4-like isoform 2-T2 [Anomaloglossus baeobatrachus]|uniref:olfactomedin-4-like isoform X2 n=1 Tax=Anomaloglossus baeobatrachus TaxID=238106 RepID=UPI003F5019B6
MFTIFILLLALCQIHAAILQTLTKRVEVMEKEGLSNTELNFELLKLEIKEMQTLTKRVEVMEKEGLSNTELNFELLKLEIKEMIHSISIMVNQMEDDDNNNVLVIRREFKALQKQLEEYEKNQATMPNPKPPLPLAYDVNISKPSVVQLNWRGFSYKFGAWGSDSFLGADQGMQFVAPLNTDERTMNTLRLYNTYNDLLIYKHKEEKSLPVSGQGGGMIMYNKSLYYNCYNTQNLCKLNLQTNAVEQKALTDATYNRRISYSSSPLLDINFAADETGFWVIYTTEADGGNIHIVKVNVTTLELMQTWSTSQDKRDVTNTFMASEVLYATRALNTKQDEIFYMYDTKTSKESYMSVPFDKMRENVQSLSYNPNDQKLYMYNDGYLITYDLTFKELKLKESQI